MGKCKRVLIYMLTPAMALLSAGCCNHKGEEDIEKNFPCDKEENIGRILR